MVATIAALFVTAVVMTTMAPSTTTTKHVLLNTNTVEVTESQVTCKNGASASVTTAVRGELNALSTERTSFSSDKWRRRMTELDRESDDEQGHVVASAFGGPTETWNLVPQHRSVNRRINAQNSLLNRWDEFEKWVRKELKKSGAPVKFSIDVKYAPGNGCRPVGFKIDATNKVGQPGFAAEFDNDAYGSFAVSSQPRRG